MIESWIDIPNLQTVHLPGSFRYVHSKSIDSIFMNMNEWIDASPRLADLLPFTFDEINSNATSISIPLSSFNMADYTTLNFSQFTLLEELEIGNVCFMYINAFLIDGLNHLKSLKIGMNSFTKKKNSYGNDESRSFHLLNCDKLGSIEVGKYSFSDYSGGFELNNLPKLSTIKIGEIGDDSNSFYYCSFVVKGIMDVILLMNRSSTFEFDWIGR